MPIEQRVSEFLEVHLPFPPTVPQRPFVHYERRVKPRSLQTFAARVWGVDAADEAFSFDCEVENISSSGVYLIAPLAIKLSSHISVVVRLAQAGPRSVTAGIKGRVIRIEPQPDGQNGIAIKTTEYRFL